MSGAGPNADDCSKQTKLKSAQKDEIDRRLEAIHNDVTNDLQRRTRALTFYKKMKATEFRFILLYAGPVIFKGILKPEIYNNYLLFHAASRILCYPDLVQEYSSYAREYFKKFFQGYVKLYGLQSASLNLHNISHVTEDVLNMEAD